MADRQRRRQPVPTGRVRRTAPLAAMAAQTAGDAVTDILRRRLQGQRGTSVEFHLRNAERYATFLSQSKGVLMKAGQILSFVDTAGLVPDEYEAIYQHAFAALRTDAQPMDYDLTAAVIEADLGAPPEQLFAAFDPAPLAAASIGQVHAARLLDGTKVAVKVQYPGVAEAIRNDLDNTELLATLLRFAKGLVPGLTNIDVRAIADEVAERIGEEVDYGTELANQEEFAELYRDHPFIRIPAAYADLSGPRVLTMELAQGHRWEDAIDADQEMRNGWGEAIDRFFYGTIGRWGLFNADPHPGNYLFHDDGTVTFLDFGCVKRFDKRQQAAFFEVADAVLQHDAEWLMRLFLELGFLNAKDAPSAQELMDFYRPTFAALLAPQPFTFTREFAATTLHLFLDPFGPGQAVNRKLVSPGDFLFTNRIYIGMNSILGALGATANWRAIYDEGRTGVSASDMGASDIAWFAETRSAGR